MKALALIIGVASLIASAQAATIAVIRGTGNPGVIAAVEGTALSAGGYSISIGTFTNTLGATEEPLITSTESLQAAIASFDTFATLTAPTSGATQGTITGQFTSLGGADPNVFNLKPIYFLVGNGATIATSTHVSIFRLTTPTAFPANVAAAGSTNATIANGAAITVVGTAGVVNGNNLGLVAVPEPSASVLLGLLGVAGLIRRRR
ncbi:PEP-CTERM sorting domain-containing protein [Luteolibacter sp. GHJ8]|uniref:PEP-CTERM sorting domain-containing protein n=1 Tax=Luteolibacter rhizosphaerae TaxID=2989719 RepID=A0ABT3G0T2_9BACT|nr:PEP-CTERM sorting domain-containing protein [Luteolibacter rhizosphaerae]MCW1913126.1 PEP-CTERM sorting domain-containing protein [Luteolibacter rhizosphaerae]